LGGGEKWKFLYYKFTAGGEALFLYLESHRVRNAFQFDPLYAVNVSQINPLPHQIEAVYHYFERYKNQESILSEDYNVPTQRNSAKKR